MVRLATMLRFLVLMTALVVGSAAVAQPAPGTIKLTTGDGVSRGDYGITKSGAWTFPSFNFGALVTPPANGGTGSTSPTGIPQFNGASAPTFISPGTGVAEALGLAASGSAGGFARTTGAALATATLTTPTILVDDLSVSPTSRQQGTYIEFYSPYFAGITGPNPSGSFGVQFLEYGKVNGTGAQTLVANVNPGASICTTTSNCSGDIDLDVWDGFDQVLEVYSVYATASGNPGGIQPGASNRNVLGSANYTWKWVFADAYYVQDATLALIQLNSTTANQSQEILFKNATNNTFAIIAAYSGGNYFSVYDVAKGGNILFAAANGAMSISPGGALTLAPVSGGVIYAAPTGTPVASLCLDAGGNIIKKTTAGSCI